MFACAIILLDAASIPDRETALQFRGDGGRKHERMERCATTQQQGDMMRLEGIHHVTCITGDAPGNVDFYTRVLGLRLGKKTGNQDAPTVSLLFSAEEEASPGADITFFEYPGARRGRPGDGMVHTVTFRVADED